MLLALVNSVDFVFLYGCVLVWFAGDVGLILMFGECCLLHCCLVLIMFVC